MADRVLQVRFLGDTDQLGKATENIGSKFSGMKVAAGAAAAAAGAAITSGIANALEFGAAQKKLEAQMGGASELSRTAGQVAGSLYSQAYGESLGQVNDAVRTVIQSGAVMEDATSNEIEGITASAMSLAQAFDVDVSESMRAAGQLVRTGLAANATQAMDLITASFQQFGPQAQDVLDTITEYSVQFQKLGLSGPQAMGLIRQGIQAGARDTDTLADAIKEFSIRAVDGSKTTIDGFKSLGLNADDTAKKIAAGGPVAAQMFDVIVDKLRGVHDPLEQERIAVELFGTKAEDLGKSLFALDPSRAVDAMGQIAGASSNLDMTIGDTAQNKITAMQRKWQQWTASLIESKGPLGDITAAIGAFGGGGLEMVSNIGMIALAMKGLGVTSLFTAGAFEAAWAALTGPVGIAVALIAGAALLIYANWDKVKGIFSGIGDVIGGTLTWAKDRALDFVNWISGVPGYLADLPGRILSGLGQLPGMLGQWALDSWNSFTTATSNWWTGTALPFISNLPYNIGYALGSLIGILAKLAIDGFNAFVDNGIAIAMGIVDFATRLPGMILNGIVALPGILGNLASNAWSSFWNATSSIWSGTVWPFLSSIPGRVGNFLTSLPGVLWNAGSAALHGLHDGAIAGWGIFWGFITSIPGRIASGVGDLGRLLWNAGKSVIDGLLAGIKAGYQNMINFVSGIADGIAAHKGPLDYDRRLLIPAGTAIMGGLLEGLRSYYGRVDSFVSGIGDRIAAAIAPTAASQLGLQAASSYISSGAPAMAFVSPDAVRAASASGTAQVKLTIDSAGSRFDDILVEVLKAAIRGRGGDPTVLGI